jgi:hypothetical protein
MTEDIKPELFSLLERLSEDKRQQREKTRGSIQRSAVPESKTTIRTANQIWLSRHARKHQQSVHSLSIFELGLNRLENREAVKTRCHGKPYDLTWMRDVLQRLARGIHSPLHKGDDEVYHEAGSQRPGSFGF